MAPKKAGKEVAKSPVQDEASKKEVAAAAAAAARAKAKAAAEAAEAKRREREKRAAVDLASLQRFLFPANLAHPESTGRLELYALYGPTDSEGRLRGGLRGSHAHTDAEIRQMIQHETREALFGIFNHPRSTVEVVVDELMPLALAETYSWQEVLELLKGIPRDDEGKLNFGRIQRAVFRNQEQRLHHLKRGSESARQRRSSQAPFQSEAAAELTFVLRRKKHNDQEEELSRTKRLGNVGSLVAGLEHQNDARAIFANVTLARPLGGTQDKWDRYCSIRKSGKSSHVMARNTPRPHVGAGDDCVADRHANCSSLVAALVSAR